MQKNYRDTARVYFNSVTGRSDRSWARAAAAYYSQLAGKTKPNFVDAMNAYYGGIKDGTVVVPASVANGATITMANSTNTKTVSGTAVVTGSALTRVSAPATAAIVTTGQALTGVTPTGTFATTVTFTVAGGVITAIALS